MPLSELAAGAWATGSVASFAPTIPGTPVSGNRMFVWASWKDFSVTATCANNNGSWSEVTEFADGAVAQGNGTGSMKVACWYKDWVSGDTNPTVTWSTQPNIAAMVVTVWSKGATETWDTPTFVTGAWPSQSTGYASASSTTTVPNGAVVFSLLGIRDDSATFTRPTDGIRDSGGLITWNASLVGSPAPHATTTTNNDMACDLSHRIVNAGASGATLQAGATLSAAETGAMLFVIQSVTGAPSPSGTIDAYVTSSGYEARMDFTTKGTIAMPAAIDTGQPSTLTYAPDSTALPHIVSNRSVIDTTSAVSAAGYQTVLLDGTITYMECDFNWATSSATSTQSVGLVAWTDAMPSGVLGAATNNSPAHCAFTSGGWEYSLWDAVTNQTLLTTHTYATAITDTRTQHVSVRIDKANSTAYCTGADGVEVQVSHAKMGTLVAPYLCAEHFYNAANTETRIQIQKFAGTSRAGGILVKGLQAAFTGSQSSGTPTGTMGATMTRAVTALAGVEMPSGTVAAALTRTVFAGTAAQTQTGTVAAALQKPTASLTGAMQPSGAIAVAMQRLSAAATGAQSQSGPLTSSLLPATMSASGAQAQSGTVAAALLATAISASGSSSAPSSATLAANLSPLIANLTGGMLPSGIIAASLLNPISALSGAQTQAGILASALTPLSAALSGAMQPSGVMASTLPAALASLSGAQIYAGIMTAALLPATASLLATMLPSGTMAAALTSALASLVSTQIYTGTIAAALRTMAFAATNAQDALGTMAAATQPPIANLSGAMAPRGAISTALTPTLADLVGGLTTVGTITVTLQPSSSGLAGAMTPTGTVSATLQQALGSLIGVQAYQGTIAADLVPLAATLGGEMYTQGALAATLIAASAMLAGEQAQAGSMDVTLPLLVAALYEIPLIIEGVVGSILQTPTFAGISESYGPPDPDYTVDVAPRVSVIDVAAINTVISVLPRIVTIDVQ